MELLSAQAPVSPVVDPSSTAGGSAGSSAARSSTTCPVWVPNRFPPSRCSPKSVKKREHSPRSATP
jgi:hypothetical protein